MEAKPTEATKPKAAVKVKRARRPRRDYSAARRAQVTPLERQSYELREKGLTWAAVACEMDRDQSSVRKAYDRALTKIPEEGQLKSSPNTLEETDPGKYAELVDALTPANGKDVNVAATARRLNVPRGVAQSVAKHLRSTYFPTKIVVREVKTKALKDLWAMTAEDALRAITPIKLEDESAKNLGILAAIATEKWLLLKGQPTQIVRTESDRTKLGELVGAFMEEAKRRDCEMKISGEGEVLDVECTRYGGDD